MDALGHETFAVVGNSAGGAIALSLACARPRAVTRVVAVGSMGFPMPLPAGLDALWAAESAQAVAELITFAPPSAEARRRPRGGDGAPSRGTASCSRRRASAGSTSSR